jgi:hypothetical protein
LWLCNIPGLEGGPLSSAMLFSFGRGLLPLPDLVLMCSRRPTVEGAVRITGQPQTMSIC